MSSPQRHATKRGKRGECTGWTPGAARRNRDFLYSIDVKKLNPELRAAGQIGSTFYAKPELKLHGLALTLTARDVPESSAELHRRLRTWTQRQRERGLVRLHWVIEFTKRGVPHVHVAAWYETTIAAGLRCNCVSLGGWGKAALEDWTEIAAASGTQVKGQHGAEIVGVEGWLAYLAKHAARGAAHYQRRRSMLPKGWQNAGRLWGHCGDWPSDRPDVEDIPDSVGRWLLRLTRKWLITKAKGRKELARYRRLLRHGKEDPLAYGRFSMWMPRGTLELLLGAAVFCEKSTQEQHREKAGKIEPTPR